MPQLFRRGKETTVSQEAFEAMIEKGEIDPEMIGKPLKEGGVEVKQMPNGKVKIRRDWTKAEREAMGEITDAAVTVPQTIVHLHNILEHAKFLKEVADVEGAVLDPAVAKGMDEAEIGAAGFVKVPNSKKYGALAGQYVRKDVYEDINAINDNVFDTFFGSDNEVGKLFKSYLRMWKKSKTVWNAPTHFNNLTSNFFLMHLAGLNAKQIAENLGRAAAMMKEGARLADLETKAAVGMLGEAEKAELAALKKGLRHYLEARELGILNTSFLEDIGHTGGEVTAAGRLAKLDGKLSRLYQAEDAVNKLAMYGFLRAKGWDKEAARVAVEAIMPDYSRPMAKAWRFLRDTGVTPFVAWTYYTFPKMFRLVKTKEGAKQAAKVLALLYAYQYAKTGVLNPYDESIPKDFQMSRVGISRDGDHVTTVKVDRMIPYMQPMSPVRFARDFIGSGIWQTALGGLMGTKLYNGRPVTSDNKPAVQQAYDYLKYIAQGLTPIPGEASAAWDIVDSVLRQKRNRVRSGDIVPRTTGQELLKLLGVNTLTYDREKVKRKAQKRRSDKKLW